MKLNKLNFDYELFEKSMTVLKEVILREEPELILAPSRGGLIPGVRLSHLCNLPLGLIESSRLDYIKSTVIHWNQSELSRMSKIVIVEDILDTGKTLTSILDVILGSPGIKENTGFEIVVLPLVVANNEYEYPDDRVSIYETEVVDQDTWVDFWWEEK